MKVVQIFINIIFLFVTGNANAQNAGEFNSNSGVAVIATSVAGTGIIGSSTNKEGVRGISTDKEGVHGTSSFGDGVSGATFFGVGVYGISGTSNGGYFICGGKTEPDLVIGGNDNNDDCVIASEPTQPGSDLFLRANDAVVIELDKDQSENGQFEIRNGAGTILLTVNETGTPLTTATGAYLSSAGVWTNAPVTSNARSLQKTVEPVSVLSALRALPIHYWSTKDGPPTQHMSPSPKDFYRAFGCGEDEQHLAPSDMAAVALAAVQALHKMNQSLWDRLDQQEKEMSQLRNDCNKLRNGLNELIKKKSN